MFSWRGTCTFKIHRFHWYFPNFVIAGGLKNQCKQGRFLITKWEAALGAGALSKAPLNQHSQENQASSCKSPPVLIILFLSQISGFVSVSHTAAGEVWGCIWWAEVHTELCTLRIFVCTEGQLQLSLEMSHFQQDCPQISLHAAAATAALCNWRFCFCPSPLSNNLLTIRAFLKGKCWNCSPFLPFPVCFLQQQNLWDTKGLNKATLISFSISQILQDGFAPLWVTTHHPWLCTSPLSVPLAGPFHHFFFLKQITQFSYWNTFCVVGKVVKGHGGSKWEAWVI